MATLKEEADIILAAYCRGFGVEKLSEGGVRKVPELADKVAAMLDMDRWTIISIHKARGKTGVEELVRMLPPLLSGRDKALEFVSGYQGERTVIDMANALFKRAQTKLETTYGRASTDRGPIENSKLFKKDFPLTATIAQMTGLDFVAMTVVLVHAGRIGLERVLSKCPPELPGRDEAVRMVRRDGLIYGEGAEYLQEVAPPTMPVKQRAEVILDEVGKAYELKYGSMEVRDTLDMRDQYELCAKLSDLLDMDFALFVIPYRKGGQFGLEQAIQLLPDGLEKKREALMLF